MSFERIMGIDVTDEETYYKYRKAMMPILKNYEGAFGFDFKVSEVLLSKTNNNINRVFTIEFPSEDKMQQFFASLEYIAVKNQYFNRSVNSVTVIALHEKPL